MVIKLITQQWVKGIHTRRIIGPVGQVSIVSSKGCFLLHSWKSPFRVSNKTIEKIQKQIDFAARFNKTIVSKHLDFLSFIFTLSSFSIRQILKMNKYRQINNHFNCNFNFFKSPVNSTFQHLHLYRKNYYQYNQAKEIVHGTSGTLEKRVSPKQSDLCSLIKVGRYINYSPAKENKNSHYLIHPIFERVSKSFRINFENLRMWQRYSDEAVKSRSIFSRKSLNEINEVPLMNRLNKGHGKKIHEHAHVKRESLWKNMITKLTRTGKFSLQSRFIEQSVYRLKKSKRPARDDNVSTTSQDILWQKITTTPSQMPVAKSSNGEKNGFIPGVNSTLSPVSLQFINKKPRTVEKEVNHEEVEKTVVKKVVKNLEKRIDERVHNKFSLNSVYTHKLTEHIYSNLCNRIVLEKERIGGF